MVSKIIFWLTERDSLTTFDTGSCKGMNSCIDVTSSLFSASINKFCLDDTTHKTIIVTFLSQIYPAVVAWLLECFLHKKRHLPMMVQILLVDFILTKKIVPHLWFSIRSCVNLRKISTKEHPRVKVKV